MTTSLFLSLRESLEAVLIVGIILSTLTQQHKDKLKPYVYIGSIAGLLISLIGGFLLYGSAQALEEETLEIIEGIMMLVASGLIAYFVIWLSQQNSDASASLTNKVSKTSTGIGLALLAFFGILREGSELVVFTLANLSTQANDVAIGTILGIVLAIIIGIVIFKSSIKLNLNWIFKILGLVLIFIGSDLFVEGLVEFSHNLESFEVWIQGSYIAVSLWIFLKEDLRKLLKR
jgi:high-affinity iron transporter